MRLTVYDAVDLPLIRSLSLYSFDTSIFAEEERIKSLENLAHGASANVIYGDHEVEVELGGIFPFNTVTFNGEGMHTYEISVFNGATYDTVLTSKNPYKNEVVRLEETYRSSYKLKISFKGPGPASPELIDIGVFET